MTGTAHLDTGSPVCVFSEGFARKAGLRREPADSIIDGIKGKRRAERTSTSLGLRPQTGPPLPLDMRALIDPSLNECDLLIGMNVILAMPGTLQIDGPHRRWRWDIYNPSSP